MSFDVWSVLSEETSLTVRNHVLSAPNTEVGGFLLGYHGDDHEPPRGIVAVEAWDARGDLTTLTFTHAAWEHVHRIQDEHYPDTSIIGWYHSHPGHGIFLSGHDQFIQRHFFGAPWQIAVVVDPIRRTEGMFAWARGEVVLISERALDDAGAPAAPWSGDTAFTPRHDLPAAAAVQSAPLVVVLDEPEPDVAEVLPPDPAPAPTPASRPLPAPARRRAVGPALLWIGAAAAVLTAAALLILR